MLTLRNVQTYYGDLQALYGVSLSVKEGEIVSVIGNNGAGKTTTLMTISGVLRPRKGEIHFDGRGIDGLKPAQIVDAGLGHVPEGRQLFPTMTVEENLLMGACSRRARGRRGETMAPGLRPVPALARAADDSSPGRCRGASSRWLPSVGA